MVISNVYPDDNRGGAALTRACIEAVEAAFPKLEHVALLSILPFSPANGQFRHTRAFRPNYRILQPLFSPKGPFRGLRAVFSGLGCLAGRVGPRMNVETYNAVISADLVVSRGGVIFWQPRPSFRFTPNLWLRTFPLRLALRRQVPVAIYGAHLGPLPSRLSRWVVGSILRRAYLIIVRDLHSEELATSLGCRPPQLRRAPDSVMRLNNASVANDRLGSSEQTASDTYAAVTVSGNLGRRSSEATTLLKNVIQELLQFNLVERAVFVLQVDGTEASDKHATYEFVEQLKCDRCTIVDKDLSVEQLLDLYSRARCVVGMRLHSTILALVAGTIGFPLDLGQSHKVRSVFAEFGLEDLVLTLGSSALAGQVVRHHILQGADAYCRIDEAVRNAKSRLLMAESGFAL